MANLWRVVDALSPDLPLLATSPAPHTKQGDNFEGEKTTETDGADDDGIGALVQKLAYMAGRSGMPFTHGPMTMVVAYLYVAELSFSGGYWFFNQRPQRLAFQAPSNKQPSVCGPSTVWCTCPGRQVRSAKTEVFHGRRDQVHAEGAIDTRH